MTKTVIALKGKANVGKSNTIRKVYALLISKYKDAVSEHLIMKTDIRVVLTINGIKIGIASQGDPPGQTLAKNLKFFINVKCRVIICATRTKGITVKVVEEIEEKGYKVIWLRQNDISDVTKQELNNRKMAKTIVNELENIIAL